MSIEELSAAIEQQPEPPCTKYSCAWQGRCAQEKLACRAFKHFVVNGVSLSPDRLRWPKRQRGVKSIIMDMDAPTPKRKHYDELFLGVSNES